MKDVRAKHYDRRVPTKIPMDWQRTTVDIPNELKRGLQVYCAQKGTTITRLFNTLVMALLTGDIYVDASFMMKRIHTDTSSTLDELLKVPVYDKDGKLLNPTSYSDVPYNA